MVEKVKEEIISALEIQKGRLVTLLARVDATSLELGEKLEFTVEIETAINLLTIAELECVVVENIEDNQKGLIGALIKRSKLFYEEADKVIVKLNKKV